MSAEIDRELKREVAAATTHTSLGAKQNAAVNFGGLKSSIRKDTDKNRGLTGEVIVGVGYGPFIEFGTGNKVNVPNELHDYAMQFKGAGIREVNLSARPYLYPAFFINRQKFIRACDAILKKVL